MKKRIIGFLGLTTCFFVPAGLFAQQLPLSNQYIVNKFSLSPAYAGINDAFEVFGDYKNEWINIPGAPEFKSVSANGKLNDKMGLGGTLSSFQAGLFQDLSASLSYAYHLEFGGIHKLSFGLSAGLLESRVNIAGASVQADPIAIHNADVSSLVLDMGFGILYRMKTLHVGIGLPRLLNSQVKDISGNTVYTLAMQQGFNVGYLYQINDDWGIDPVARISMVKDIPMYYDLAVPVVYKKKIWLSPIYKKSYMAVALGGNPYSTFVVNYSYEFASSGIMGQSGGSHEIAIGWKLGSGKRRGETPAPDAKKPYYEWLNK